MLDGKANGCSQWFLSHRSVVSGLEKPLLAGYEMSILLDFYRHLLLRFVPTYQDFFLVCSDTDLCRLLFVSAQRHTRNNPKVLTRGGFEDQAIAILDRKLHEANLSCTRPEGARLNYE